MMCGIYLRFVFTVTLCALYSDALISVGHHQKNYTETEPEQSADIVDTLDTMGTLLEESDFEAVVVNDTKTEDITTTKSLVVPAEANDTVVPTALPHSQAYDALYERGVKHYLDNEWHQCVAFMEQAIQDYHWYHKQLVGCRRKCKTEADNATLLTAPLDNTQTFYETTIRNALCLLKCRRDNFSARHNHVASTAIDADFEIKKQYDYLQLCLFKIGRYQEAASAAVTVLASQPDHKVMTENLKQYIDNFSADPDQLENLELEPYAKEYIAGDHAHTDEDYETSVKHMEAALGLYWTAIEDCRLMCEEPFDQGWFPDFVSSVANHFTFTFRCKRRCAEKLSNLYGEPVPRFLASIFNYLQYGYQKLEQIPSACAAVENYLELEPTDAAMLRNKQFYQTEYQKMGQHFTPRKEVVAHAARERYETNLLHFIDTEFVFLEDDKKELRPAQPVAPPVPTIKETLSDMLSTVFGVGQPSLDVLQKGEL